MNKLNNKELLELLKTDVEAFNDYRINFPEQEIDFKFANFEGVDLKGANLKGVHFKWDTLKGTNLSGVNLAGSYLLMSDLEALILRGLIFTVKIYRKFTSYFKPYKRGKLC